MTDDVGGGGVGGGAEEEEEDDDGAGDVKEREETAVGSENDTFEVVEGAGTVSRGLGDSLITVVCRLGPRASFGEGDLRFGDGECFASSSPTEPRDTFPEKLISPRLPPPRLISSSSLRKESDGGTWLNANIVVTGTTV